MIELCGSMFQQCYNSVSIKPVLVGKSSLEVVDWPSPKVQFPSDWKRKSPHSWRATWLVRLGPGVVTWYGFQTTLVLFNEKETTFNPLALSTIIYGQTISAISSSHQLSHEVFNEFELMMPMSMQDPTPPKQHPSNALLRHVFQDLQCPRPSNTMQQSTFCKPHQANRVRRVRILGPGIWSKHGCSLHWSKNLRGSNN